jgi:hypothetical protein
MAWWDDAAEAVGSAVGWVGDAAEAVVDTATEVVEEVTESASDAADAGLDGLRDGAASVGPALGAVANVVLGARPDRHRGRHLLHGSRLRRPLRG